MSHRAVRQAFEARLATWATARAPALRVAWENTQFTPANGETYLRAFTLPAPANDPTLGGDGRILRGVFQVSVVVPINKGPGDATGIADEIAALYPTNTQLVSGATTVQVIQPASIAPALVDETTYTVPVSLQYMSVVN